MAFVFGTCAERSTGISPDAGGALSVYPNPATSFLYIDFNDRLMQRVSIVDITGRVVLDRRIENLHRLSVDVSDLSEGLYIVVVEGENARAVSRITIKHTL
jgi:hypothetical protein